MATHGTPTLVPSLEQAFRAASPRLAPPPTPIASLLIHGGVLALWIVLFARAFGQSGLLAWSSGLAYVGYDTLLIGFVFVQTLKLVEPRRLAPPPGRRATLGVVLAARDEAGALPATLAALLAQTDPPDAIVIADDGSTDSSAAVLARFGLAMPDIGCISAPSAAHPNLRWLRLPHGGKARALNASIPQVETDILLTVDADTVLDPAAIGVMREAFSAGPDLVAATGVLRPVCAPTIGGRIFGWFQTYEYIRNFLSRAAWARLDSLLLISGAFAGFRRSALIEVGGFDAQCLVEDYELIHRLLRYAAKRNRGWRTEVLGRALATTDAPATPGAFLRQRRRWFGGFLQTQFWYRDMVGNRAYRWLGLIMLPVKAVDSLQPIYGLTALALLGVFLCQCQAALVLPIVAVMVAKIGLDLGFHVWSVHVYRRWTGDRAHAKLSHAVLAALAEPFSFQLFRHAGAALGWVAFLTGRSSWGRRPQLGSSRQSSLA